MSITIALDAMGGDHGAQITVPAALAFRRRYPDVRLLLVGNEEVLKAELDKNGGTPGENLGIHHAEQVVEMDEPPAQALRGKKKSSMRLAINQVKEGQADACVSAGNTGALMATAHFVLKTPAGIDRPAICTTLPTIRGHVHVLDLGANVDCTAEQLLQFGIMGSILVAAVEDKSRPLVGLLNIGEEDIKGNDVVKKAAQLFQQSQVNYRGYVEGDEIYTGDCDVIVCDGFVGNVALKTSEGLAQMIIHTLKSEFEKNIFTRLGALCAMPVLKAFRRRMDHRVYNGAPLLGLNGIVIKSHGGADAVAFEHAIEVAMRAVVTGVSEKISSGLGAIPASGDQA